MSLNHTKKNKKKYDIIFLGLAQNCEKHIHKFFNVVIGLSNKLNIYVIIGENNSSDYTFEKIKTLSKNLNSKFTFVDTTFIEKYEDRIKRLASARQKLKDKITELNIASDYICVVDMDDVLNQNFNENLIFDLKNILEKNCTRYFGISVSSKPYYYDILNFESNEFPNKDIKQLQNNRSLGSYRNRKKYIYDVQKKISIKNSFECISAFNGLCIYNFNDFSISSYLEDSNDVTPEHLFLNRKINLNSNKKIYVADFFLQMPIEHKPIGNIVTFLFEKISKFTNIFLKKIFTNG